MRQPGRVPTAGGELGERHALLEVEQVELQLVRRVAGGQRRDHREQQVRLARAARAADQRVRGGVGERQLDRASPSAKPTGAHSPAASPRAAPLRVRREQVAERADPACASCSCSAAIVVAGRRSPRLAGQRRIGHHGDVTAGHRGVATVACPADGRHRCSRTVSTGAPIAIGTSTSTSRDPAGQPAAEHPLELAPVLLAQRRAGCRRAPRRPTARPAVRRRPGLLRERRLAATSTRVCTRRIRSDSSSSRPARSPGSCTVSRPVRVSG